MKCTYKVFETLCIFLYANGIFSLIENWFWLIFVYFWLAKCIWLTEWVSWYNGLYYFRYPEMKTVTNCFVLNLAVSDILFALTIPVVGYTRITQSWELGDLTCKIVPYVQVIINYYLSYYTEYLVNIFTKYICCIRIVLYNCTIYIIHGDNSAT